MADAQVRPVRRLYGVVEVPGDKSISHRALILSAVAEGDTSIRGLSPGRDVLSTARCLRALGVPIEVDGSVACAWVEGCGLWGLRAPDRGQELDAGNSGTTLRLLAGLLAGQRFACTLTGDAHLRRRPMGRLIEPLRRMGAHIEASDGRAPLRVRGGPLRGITCRLPVASAQVQSALLLAGLYARGRTTVIEPYRVRDHTERLLAELGVRVRREGEAVSLEGGQQPQAPAQGRGLEVPADLSSAAFWIAAALLIPEARITLKGVGVNPTRTGFLDVLSEMGADLQRQDEHSRCGEPRADLIVRSGALTAVEVGGGTIPRLIDELPLLAVLATRARGETVIRDARELRVKETDRIRAVTVNLRKMGARIEEREDGWAIPGPQALRGAVLDSFSDHRIAMAFAVAGLAARGKTVIRDAEWADISYPGFWETLERLCKG